MKRKVEILGPHMSLVELPLAWGFTQANLSRLSSQFLRHMFYGTHNVQVPGLILDWCNPDERAIIYVGADLLKRGNSHKGAIYRHEGDIVGDMMIQVQGGFPGDIEVLRGEDGSSFRKHRVYESGRDEFEKRVFRALEALGMRSDFVERFKQDYIPPHHLVNGDNRCFADVGSGCKTHDSVVRTYSRELGRFFNKKYQEAHRD